MSKRLTKKEIDQYVIWDNNTFLLKLPILHSFVSMNTQNDKMYPSSDTYIHVDPVSIRRIVPSFQKWQFQNGLETQFYTTEIVYHNSPSDNVLLPHYKVNSLLSYIKRKNRQIDKALGLQKSKPKKEKHDEPIRSRNELLDL